MRWCCGASSVEPAEPVTAEQPAEKQKEAEPPLTAEQNTEQQAAFDRTIEQAVQEFAQQ